MTDRERESKWRKRYSFEVRNMTDKYERINAEAPVKTYKANDEFIQNMECLLNKSNNHELKIGVK